MSPPRFSLIFVNYQSVALLEQALISWRQATADIAAEYILVNNDERETQTVTALAERYQLNIRSLPTNGGFGQACNVGAALAKGEILFFLNPDTEYRQGSWDEIERLFKTYPRSLGGVGLIQEDNQPEAWSAGSFPTLLRLLRYKLFGSPRTPVWQASALTFPDWVSGAALLIPRVLFEELGGFDECFFLYFEDVDLCSRAKKQSLTVWRSPRFVVCHHGGGSQKERTMQKTAYYRSQIQYFLKHRPRWETQLLRWLHRFLPE